MSDEVDLTSPAEDTSQEWMDLELKLLASLVSDQEGLRRFLCQKLRDKDAFTFIPNAWMHGITLAQEGTMFQVDSFIHLPGLSTIERGLLQAAENIAPCGTIEEAELLVAKVKERYHTEKLLAVVSKPVEELTTNKLDYKSAMEVLAQELEKLSAETADTESIGLGAGHDTNLLLQKLFAPSTEQIIRTGFDELDNRAGGLAKGEQIICACPTSSGKTTFMNQLCLNMGLGMRNREYVNQRNSVLIISLEMSEEQMWRRILANLCGIEVGRFRQMESMTDAEKELVTQTAINLGRYLAETGHRLTLKGASAADLGSIRAELASHPYDIVCIDYLNLMCEGDTLWNEMGKIARELKILAQKRNFVCITAAQLDEDSLKIRYSRMVKEHCDMVLMWAPAAAATAGTGEVSSAFTEVFVDKGRNTGKFSFWVHFNFAYMTVAGVNPSEQLRMFEPTSQGSGMALPKGQVLQLPAQAAAAANSAPPLLEHQKVDNTLLQGLNNQVLTPPAAPAAPEATTLIAATVEMNSTPAMQVEAPTDAAPFVNANTVQMPGSLPPSVLMPNFNPLSYTGNVGATVAEDIAAETVAADEVPADDDAIVL